MNKQQIKALICYCNTTFNNMKVSVIKCLECASEEAKHSGITIEQYLNKF